MMTNDLGNWPVTLEELCDEFWIGVHFLTRRCCGGYDQNGRSQPQDKHEAGILGCQVKTLVRRSIDLAVSTCGITPAEFQELLMQRSHHIYVGHLTENH